MSFYSWVLLQNTYSSVDVKILYLTTEIQMINGSYPCHSEVKGINCKKMVLSSYRLYSHLYCLFPCFWDCISCLLMDFSKNSNILGCVFRMYLGSNHFQCSWVINCHFVYISDFKRFCSSYQRYSQSHITYEKSLL